MSSAIVKTFDFGGNDVGAFLNPQGEACLIAKNVCDVLGTRTDTIKHILDEDEYGEVNPNTIGVAQNGGKQPLYVTEAGFYKLVLRSRKPIAKQFQRWVAHEVLPSIRKHGGYMAGQEQMTPEQMALASMRWLESKVAEQAKQLEEQAPKVLFADAVTTSDKCILIGELAKLLAQNGVKIGQNRLFAWLRQNGYLMKRNGETNFPSQTAIEMGLLMVKETIIAQPNGSPKARYTPKVTPKGQQYFITKFLNKKGDV